LVHTLSGSRTNKLRPVAPWSASEKASGTVYRHAVRRTKWTPAEIERQPLWNNLKQDHGPFDIIGDVHGCYDELVELLRLLGYEVAPSSEEPSKANWFGHRQAARPHICGDLVDSRARKFPGG